MIFITITLSREGSTRIASCHGSVRSTSRGSSLTTKDFLSIIPFEVLIYKDPETAEEGRVKEFVDCCCGWKGNVLVGICCIPKEVINAWSCTIAFVVCEDDDPEALDESCPWIWDNRDASMPLFEADVGSGAGVTGETDGDVTEPVAGGDVSSS